MMSKTVTSLAFVAGCALAFAAMPTAHAQYYPQQPQPYMGPVQTTLETNGPQASAGDFGDWSSRRNNIASARYDRLVELSPGFRHARMRKECGPIRDAQLRDQCMASFQQFEPTMVGSSMPPRHFRHYRNAGY